MSLYQKTFLKGVIRIFSLPKLSIPLILTLGLTLGALLTVVAISSALFWQPLSGVKNEENIHVIKYHVELGSMSLPIIDGAKFTDLSRFFSNLGEWAHLTSNKTQLMINNTQYSINSIFASDNILSVLGTKLIKGQDVTIEQAEKYVWVSNSLWQNAYQGLDSALGQHLNVNNKNYIIAGIIEDALAIKSPAYFTMQENAEQIWLIEKLTDTHKKADNIQLQDTHDIALLKPNNNISPPTKALLKEWFTQYAEKHSNTVESKGFYDYIKQNSNKIEVTQYRFHLTGSSKYLLMALIITVFTLLLMAVLNLVNLFIAHYQSRNKEFALQLTLGASLLRVRLLALCENLPSFIVATITGLITAGWLIELLPTIASNTLPMLSQINIDNLTIFSSIITLLLLSLLFSYLVLFDVNKNALNDNLHSSGKGLQAQHKQLLSRGLMIFQLAISSILLSGLAMLAQQSYQAVYQDLGYQLGNSYAVNLNIKDHQWLKQLQQAKHYQGSQLQQLHQQLTEIIENDVIGSRVIIPSYGPMRGGGANMTTYREDNSNEPAITYQTAYLNSMFFQQFNIPFMAGANLTEQQIINKENLVVIDQAAATVLYPKLNNQEIIGLQFKPIKGAIINGIVPTIINMPGSIPGKKTMFPSSPTIYSANITINNIGSMTLTVSLPEDNKLTKDMIAAQITKKFPQLELTNVNNLQQLKYFFTHEQRTNLYIILALAGLTLLLAAIGIAGLTLMTTHQRKYELAIRMATGATQRRLISFILKDAGLMLVVGLGLGFIISVFSYEKLQQQLTMLPDFNWLALSAFDISLVLIVILSIILPTWRVISADPMVALRQDD